VYHRCSGQFDDAFMFYGLAMARAWMHPGGSGLSDIETLSLRVRGKCEVTAVSFRAYAHLVDRYACCAGSMGDKYGPILVATRPSWPPGIGALKGLKVGIPGKLVSVPHAADVRPDFEAVIMPFDEIQQAVAGRVDAGCHSRRPVDVRVRGPEEGGRPG
jgi:predicted solute-binding protein